MAQDAGSKDRNSGPLLQDEIDFLFDNKHELESVIENRAHLGVRSKAGVIEDHFDYSVFSSIKENEKLERNLLNWLLVKQLTTFASPIILIQIAIAAFAFVDVAFASKLGSEAFAAIGLAMSIFQVSKYFGVGCALGVEALFAQSLGAKDVQTAIKLLFHSLFFAVAITLPFCITMAVSELYVHYLIDDKALQLLINQYLELASWSLIPATVFTICAKFLNAAGYAKKVLTVALIGNAINFALNYIFVLGIGSFESLGLFGSGLATLVSHLLIAVVTIWMTWSACKKFGWKRREMAWNLATMKSIAKIGLPVGVQFLFEFGSFTMFALLIGKLGSNFIAGHTLWINIYTIMMNVTVGMSAAIAVVVGTSVGRRDLNFAYKASINGLLTTVSLAVFCLIMVYLFRGPIIGVFSEDQAVIQVSESLALIVCLTYIFESLSIVLASVLRGALGITRLTMLTFVIATYCFGLPLAYALQTWTTAGLYATWLSWLICYAGISYILAAVWYKNRFQVKRVT